MATYNVYDNILIKLESIYLKVEMEVDREITALITERNILSLQLNDLKSKVEILNSLNRSFDLYSDQHIEFDEIKHKLLYQFAMLQNGKKILLLEIKNLSGELESLIFKEYAIKQKIQELRQYKTDLNNQKECFMKDCTVDGYTEAVKQLELVENQFNRIMYHRNLDKQNLVSRFFAVSRTIAKSFKKPQELH